MLPSGDVITNYHVVKAGARYTVGRGKQGTPATVKAGDPDKDLCLLTASGLTAKPARLGRAARLKVGEPVYAVGAPQGLELSLSEGIVSQLRGGPPPIIQTTVAISGGSSGGGLFNAEAELVGITTFYLKDGQSLNFDTNGITTFVQDGERWLLDHDYLVRNTTEHSMLSVLRDGRCASLVPSLAGLVASGDLPGMAAKAFLTRGRVGRVTAPDRSMTSAWRGEPTSLMPNRSTS